MDAFKKKLVPVSSADMELGHAARTRRTAAASTTGKPENSISVEGSCVDFNTALVLKAVLQTAV